MPSKLCLVQRFIPKVSPFKTRLRRKSRTGSAHGAWAAPGLPGGPCPFPEPPPPPELGGSNPAFQHELEELDGAGQARESRSKSVQKWGAGTLPAPRPANAVLIMIIMLIKLTGWTGGELADSSS